VDKAYRNKRTEREDRERHRDIRTQRHRDIEIQRYKETERYRDT